MAKEQNSKRRNRSNPDARRRIACTFEGCTWEGELRGYRGHHLYAHHAVAPDVPPTARELAVDEGREIERSKFSPPLPPAAPKRAKTFEEEMGFE